MCGIVLAIPILSEINDMSKTKVKVVVPIYKEHLPERELLSLKNNASVLSRYPQVLLAPEGLNVEATLREVPNMEVVRVSPAFLGSNGIAGYNQMMLSKEFYSLFADCEYILICQSDAWIFRDELEAWCDKGYDYVGAPWPKRKVYDLPIIKQYMWLRHKLLSREGKIMRQDYYGHVGNGGLSLRRVQSCLEACDRYADRVEEFRSGKSMVHNEDWFWALVPREFRYPSFDEALGFSFDVHPKMCYDLSGGKLPFGCHGWFKKRNYPFWQAIIEK